MEKELSYTSDKQNETKATCRKKKELNKIK